MAAPGGFWIAPVRQIRPEELQRCIDHFGGAHRTSWAAKPRNTSPTAFPWRITRAMAGSTKQRRRGGSSSISPASRGQGSGHSDFQGLVGFRGMMEG